MAITRTLISSYTVPTATSSVTLSSIPSTYKDLLVITSIRTNRNTDGYADIVVRFNGDSANNYRFRMGQGDGANTNTLGVNSGDTESTFAPYLMASLSGDNYSFGVGTIHIFNYASATRKIGRADTTVALNRTNGIQRFIAGGYSGTSAINSISFTDGNSVNIQPYSTFYLYGITNS